MEEREDRGREDAWDVEDSMRCMRIEKWKICEMLR